MSINSYRDMDVMALDVMKEIGSIGTGSAATALSGMVGETVRMTVPEIEIKGFNEAITVLGGPEDVVAAVLVRMSGDITGTMLFLLRMDFVNAILSRILGKRVDDYSQLYEMEISVLTEVGNIMISSYINALSKLVDMDMHLSVPAIAVNMLGGIMSVPMAEMGYETDELMLIDGKLVLNEEKYDSTILMLPNIESLNKLMNKLVGGYE